MLLVPRQSQVNIVSRTGTQLALCIWGWGVFIFLIFFRLQLHFSENTRIFLLTLFNTFGSAFNEKWISWTLTYYTYIIWKNYGENKQQKYEQCQLMKSSHFPTSVCLIKIELSDYSINYVNYLA